ncbi:MAG: molybdopterin-dependent oxidoreductase [Verrucomicrobiaceae bacterium]|nr:molybdopterin-dependent oxidoreductase [Verrucomicrobiaceae bacterium]
MSDTEDNITPFRLPADPQKPAKETFGERLRRRRDQLGSGGEERTLSSWQSRSRVFTALVVESPHAAAAIVRMDSTEARAAEGIEAVLFARDIPPFRNALGREFSGEPLLAEEEVHYRGQPVALIIGRDEKCCRAAARLLEIDYHPTPGILTLDHALAMTAFHEAPRVCERGEIPRQPRSGQEERSGTFFLPSQQAHLIGQTVVKVTPVNGGRGFSVEARTLSPTLVRTAVARTADIPESDVQIETVDLAGVTDALELEPARLAMLGTRAAMTCGAAVVVKVDGPDSPLIRGERHPIQVDYRVIHDKRGKIDALDLALYVDGGYFATDSATVMDRATLHADSVYGIPNLRITSRLCRTNRLTSSSLPAEGSAQGAWAIEEIVRRVAAALRLSTRKVRESNFYEEGHELKTTPYGQSIHATDIQRVWHQVLHRGDFDNRVAAIQKWNQRNPCYKRGIAIVPVKFGLGDPRPERDAAAALVQILADGSVLVRVGLVDVNDGFRGQIREEVAKHLGIDKEGIRVILNDFEVLPRSTPVIGTDAAGLVLRALADACRNLIVRLREVALQLFAARGQTEVEIEAIRFLGGLVGPDISPNSPLHFKEVIEGAWRKRVNLVETGYHRTPNLWWDHELGAGWPFSAFTYAAAAAEVQVDAFTGEVQILRVDIAHEGSPSPRQNDRDFAQLMRSFTLGVGWLLSEESSASRSGEETRACRSDGVLGFGDAPFQVATDRLRPHGDALTTPGDPCAEAPVLLAACVREALWDALGAFGLDPDLEIELPLPSTPPRVLATLREISRQRR